MAKSALGRGLGDLLRPGDATGPVSHPPAPGRNGDVDRDDRPTPSPGPGLTSLLQGGRSPGFPSRGERHPPLSGRKVLSGPGRAVLLLADIMLVLQAMVIVFNREGPMRTAEWGVVVVSMALAATVGCLAWVGDDKTR